MSSSNIDRKAKYRASAKGRAAEKAYRLRHRVLKGYDGVRKANHARVKELNSLWKGGRFLNRFGYVVIHVGSGNGRIGVLKGYDLEHKLVAERSLGRRLKPTEVVHHVNFDKADNRPQNLVICTNGYHRWMHHRYAELYAKEHFARVS